MAKIVVTYDTSTKETSVTKDGKVVADLKGVSFWYDFDGKGRMDMFQREDDTDSDMSVTTHTQAANYLKQYKRSK